MLTRYRITAADLVNPFIERMEVPK
jgi:hypothetical protein